MAGKMKWSRPVRSFTPLLVVVLLVGISLVDPRYTKRRAGTLAVLFDISSSVPTEVRAAAAETIRKALSTLPRGTHIAVFVFGEEPHLLGQGRARQAGRWLRAGGTHPAQDGITDLGRALEEASSLVLAYGGGSILVVTDGIDIAGRGPAAAEAAARAGTDVHILPLPPEAVGEVAVESLDAPGQVRAGEVFEVQAIVRSTVDQRVDMVLQQDGIPVSSLGADLVAGAAHAFSFLRPAGSSPKRLAALAVAERDEDPRNNLALAEVSIRGAARIGVLGFQVQLKIEGAERWEQLPPLALMQPYDALLVRLGGSFIPSTQEQEVLARYVREGHGLMVVCDDPKITTGLRGGPLEEVLPVSLVPPRLSGDDAAVIVLVDRSGSMDETDAGRSFLALAYEAAKAVDSLLADGDRYGLIAFDVAPHIMQPLGPHGVAPATAAGLPELGAAGGTDWSSSLDLALDWLEADKASRRHVVLISDGRLAEEAIEEPSRAWPTGVTLSTVSVGDDADLNVMQRLADRHGGRHDHVQRLEDLPAVLRREGAHLRLPPTRSGPLTVRPSASFSTLLRTLTVRSGSTVLLVSAAKGAEVALQTENGDPLLTFGRAGWGRSAFLAMDATHLRSVLETGARRVARTDQPDASSLTIAVRRGKVEVDVLTPAGLRVSLPDASVRFPSGREIDVPLMWVASGLAHGSLLASEAGEYIVDSGGARQRVMIATTPERSLLSQDSDWAERLARAGGGSVLTTVGGILPRGRSRTDRMEIAPMLIALAAIVIFADATLRAGTRTGR